MAEPERIHDQDGLVPQVDVHGALQMLEIPGSLRQAGLRTPPVAGLSNPLPHQTSAQDAVVWVVAIARDADRASFSALFTLFAPKVKGYLVRNGVLAQSAEELTQEVFLSVWRKADQFDPERASVSAWIYTIARNLSVDAVRRERRPSDGRIDEPGNGQTTPEDELRSAQGDSRLRAAIAMLSEDQAYMLRLAFFEELTHAEIAALADVPLGTVKSRIRLATAHLKLALEDLV